MSLSYNQRKYLVIALNVFFVLGILYMLNYGVAIGRSGPQGQLCRYLTVRGVYEQYASASEMPKIDYPKAQGCAVLYSFDAWDQ